MAKGLTKRQELILQYILDYVEAEGYPPSIREIGGHFKIGSLRGVTVHLDALERKGYIARSNTPRSIKVVHPKYQPAGRVVMLPLLGAISAGTGMEIVEHVEETFPVPQEMVRNASEAFLLRVKGDSMIDDGIMERDMVIVKRQPNALHGDIVAAALGDEATVKRIHFAKDGTATLVPSNPNYQPIPFNQDNCRVIGKVIGLFRTY